MKRGRAGDGVSLGGAQTRKRRRKNRRTKEQATAARSEEGRRILATAEGERFEVREGKLFKVTVIPTNVRRKRKTRPAD